MTGTPPEEPDRGPAPPPPPPPPPQPATPSYSYGSSSTSKTNGFAIASLACSIGGFFVCGIGFILGVVFGYIAKNQIDQSGGTQQGRGMAIAGIIVGWIGIALGVIALVVVIAIAAATDDNDSSMALVRYALAA
jgi:Domain of unknown function (DUF4190)